MFERLNTPAEAFQHQLSSALTMEREITGMRADLFETSQDAAITKAFRHHQAETRGHAQGIERVFEIFGWEIETSSCPAIKAIEKETRASVEETAAARRGPTLRGGGGELREP